MQLCVVRTNGKPHKQKDGQKWNIVIATEQKLATECRLHFIPRISEGINQFNKVMLELEF